MFGNRLRDTSAYNSLKGMVPTVDEHGDTFGASGETNVAALALSMPAGSYRRIERSSPLASSF